MEARKTRGWMMSRATGSPVPRYGDVSILLKVVAARRDGCVQQKHPCCESIASWGRSSTQLWPNQREKLSGNFPKATTEGHSSRY